MPPSSHCFLHFVDGAEIGDIKPTIIMIQLKESHRYLYLPLYPNTTSTNIIFFKLLKRKEVRLLGRDITSSSLRHGPAVPRTDNRSYVMGSIHG